jgi:hypothetical protein
MSYGSGMKEHESKRGYLPEQTTENTTIPVSIEDIATETQTAELLRKNPDRYRCGNLLRLRVDPL